jgi:putative endonuclease
LEGHGYEILARRWRAAGREIDLVVEKDGTIAFVEVKTRRAGSLAPPATAVDWRKQRQIAAAANAALARWGHSARSYRFDVITIELASRKPGRDSRPEITHIEDAFRLEG